MTTPTMVSTDLPSVAPLGAHAAASGARGAPTRPAEHRRGAALVMVGVSHRHSSLAVLEAVAVGEHNRAGLNDALRGVGVAQALVLSTCCRTEIYAHLEPGGAEALVAVLAAHAKMGVAELGELIEVRHGDEATWHLFRVAAGLDSRILGEVDIQDQLRSARAASAAADMIGSELQRVCVSALAVARRIHTETILGSLGRSLGRRAVDMALAAQPGATMVAVVGSGRMARVVTERLAEVGVRPLLYARRPATAARLVADDSCVHPLAALGDALRAVDVVMCTTSAAEHLIDAAAVSGALVERAGRGLTIVDLSVPRNVAAGVGALAGVELIDLEAIGPDPAEGDALAGAAARGEAIALGEVRRMAAAHRARRAVPVIVALRERVERMCMDELARLATPATAITTADLERVAAAITAKVLHAPIVAARHAAATDDAAAIERLCTLFRLETVGAAPPGGPRSPITRK